MFAGFPEALDEKRVAKVEKILKEESENSGFGVLWVTHNKNQAQRLCSKIIDLEEFRS